MSVKSRKYKWRHRRWLLRVLGDWCSDPASATPWSKNHTREPLWTTPAARPAGGQRSRISEPPGLKAVVIDSKLGRTRGPALEFWVGGRLIAGSFF